MVGNNHHNEEQDSDYAPEDGRKQTLLKESPKGDMRVVLPRVCPTEQDEKEHAGKKSNPFDV
jgi:hypothetical protein